MSMIDPSRVCSEHSTHLWASSVPLLKLHIAFTCQAGFQPRNSGLQQSPGVEQAVSAEYGSALCIVRIVNSAIRMVSALILEAVLGHQGLTVWNPNYQLGLSPSAHVSGGLLQSQGHSWLMYTSLL